MLTQEINKKINKHRLLGSSDMDDISNLIYTNMYFSELKYMEDIFDERKQISGLKFGKKIDDQSR